MGYIYLGQWNWFWLTFIIQIFAYPLTAFFAYPLLPIVYGIHQYQMAKDVNELIARDQGQQPAAEAASAARSSRSIRPSCSAHARRKIRLDRNLALELVRVTESAALASARFFGKGDPASADRAAVEAMELSFKGVKISGHIIIGEERISESSKLCVGDTIGAGGEAAFDHRARSGRLHRSARRRTVEFDLGDRDGTARDLLRARRSVHEEDRGRGRGGGRDRSQRIGVR